MRGFSLYPLTLLGSVVMVTPCDHAALYLSLFDFTLFVLKINAVAGLNRVLCNQHRYKSLFSRVGVTALNTNFSTGVTERGNP